MSTNSALRSFSGVALAWLAAVLVAAALGSIIQTQYNMAAIRALDAPVPAGTWVMVTLKDLLGFGGFYGAAVAVSFVVGLGVAALVARVLPSWRTLVFTLAGGVAIFGFLQILPVFLPAADLKIIAATRYASAVALMVMAGAVGGWVYARLRPLPGQ